MFQKGFACFIGQIERTNDEKYGKSLESMSALCHRREQM
jgi:hypothetical protein